MSSNEVQMVPLIWHDAELRTCKRVYRLMLAVAAIVAVVAAYA